MSFFSWLKSLLGFGPTPTRSRPLVLTKDEAPATNQVVLNLRKDRPGDGCGHAVVIEADYSTAYVVEQDDGLIAAAIVDAAIDIATDPVVVEAAADLFSGIADAISSIDIDFDF
jgi:hypothetical protein